MINIDKLSQTKDSLRREVLKRKKYMSMMLDFATGHKKLQKEHYALERFRPNDRRLLSSLKFLHSEIRGLQKDIALLDNLLAHQKSKHQDVNNDKK